MNSIRKSILSFATRTLQPFQKFLKPCQPNERIRCRCTLELPPKQKTAIKTQYEIPKGIMGQPTCHTHPHLLQPDHLTYSITQCEYRERRTTLINKLMSEFGKDMKNHFIIFPAATKKFMSDRIPYVFRQNSDFFYLTGCLEPNAVLLLIKPAQSDDYRSVLFLQEKDAQVELWEGPRTGCGAAPSLFAVDEARPIETFPNYLKSILINSMPAAVGYNCTSPANPDLHMQICTAIGPHTQTYDPLKSLHFMRAVKSPAEVTIMKETCSIGARAMNMAMASTRPGICESELNSVLDYTARQSGADQLAFPPVIAGGTAATHIHYIANNQLLKNNDMLLVDAGTQRWLYNSDLSRTWPVSGKFSTHHQILYELVLSVQKTLIDIVAQHHPALDKLFDQMCRLLGHKLQEEGILSKTLTDTDLLRAAYSLCPHHVSHYLGLDVHDTPLIRRNNPVTPNMVVTVEPGVYIQPNDKSVPPEFRGIGIRIEDDILVTDSGAINLTEKCVKEVDDIEALIGKHTQ